MPHLVIGYGPIAPPPPPPPGPIPDPTVDNSTPFLIGMNVHTILLAGGTVMSSTQATTTANFLAARQFKVNRTNLWVNSSAAEKAATRDYITKLNALGTKTQLMLFTATFDAIWGGTVRTDLAQLTTDAYNEMTTGLGHSGDLANTFEILNETNLVPAVTAQVPSDNPTAADYNGKTAPEAMAAICLGVCNAIKDYRTSTGRPIKIIMGTTWRNFGWLSFLASRGVTWDITGYHYYPAASQLPFSDPWWGTGGLFAQLASFGKPVSWNEFNAGEIFNSSYANANGDTLTEQGYVSVSDALKAIVAQTTVQIESLLLYELADETWQAGAEAKFGGWWDLSTPKVTGSLFTAYAGTPLPAAEASSITSRGLLTQPQLDAMLSSATPGQIASQGVNLSAMEWAQPGLRYGSSTAINMNFTMPRAADISFLASQGFTKNRLCMLWELIQPVLVSSPANGTVLAAHGISAAGQVVPRMMGYILDVLDAHATAGIKCILDLHNYCRYQDFKYQTDGSVIGFQPSSSSFIQPWTNDGSQVWTRCMALAPGNASNPTITQTDYNTFWANFINYVEAGTGRTVKQHSGLAGYALMNEPHDMPATGANAPYTQPEDKTIWNTFAQGAVNAIRAIDSITPIYCAGNDYEIPWSADPGGSYLNNNPGYPLSGSNLVYEAHFYLDHVSAGHAFDWTTESSFTFSAGESTSHGATTSTGTIRAQYCVDFVNGGAGRKMAVTELGMPSGNINWQTSMEGALSTLYTNGIEFFLWAGGNHWPVHDFSLNGVPNFKRGKTFIPQAFGPMHKAAARTKFDVWADADKNFGAAGTVCTVTVYTRGYSPTALLVNLAKTGTGTLSASSVTIPAGANQQVTFTYTTAGTEDATVTFSGQTVLPSVMHFYSMDPVTYAATDPVIAGRAALAKYSALEWLAENAYTDYMGGVPATSGVAPRAIWNSGFGENYYNAHGMKTWWTPSYDSTSIATTGVDGNSKKFINFTSNRGLWSHKLSINPDGPGSDPTPVNIQPYGLADNHFHITAIKIPNQTTYGTVFVANNEQGQARSELRIEAGNAVGVINTSGNTTFKVTSPNKLTINSFHVMSMRSTPGAQVLRVDKAQIASMGVTPGAAELTSMEIGFLYGNFFPLEGFTGSFYGAITGKGNPSDAELGVMEEYLAQICGTTLAPPASDYPSTVSALTDWSDPSTFSSLLQSSTGGGTVTSVGQVIGQVNSRAPGTINLTVPDTARFVLRQDGGGKYYLDTGAGWNTTGGGGSTTGFFFIAALKINGGYINTLWSDHTSLTPNNGYEVLYDAGLDRYVFSVGNGSARTNLVDSTVINFNTGPVFVVMAWDDGTNLNIQVNNGTVNSVVRPTPVAGNAVPTVYQQDTSGTQGMFANNYGLMWAKNSGLTSTERAGLKTWLGAKAGLTL